MTRIDLPDRQVRPLGFYLALEEWVAHHLPAGEYFFTWDVNPTVIIGHNQDLDAEVDVAYCRANNIDIVRRRSGGGCVYADRDNIMISYVTAETNVEQTFRHYIGIVAGQLRRMGLDAEASGRNDIEVDGRKISGNAYYLLPNRSIVHGTMLWHTDMQHMTRAITPDKAKLASHGVNSVPARVTTVKTLRPDWTATDFRQRLVDGLTTDIVTLTADQLQQVSRYQQRYDDPNWLNHSKMQPHN